MTNIELTDSPHGQEMPDDYKMIKNKQTFKVEFSDH